MPSPPACVQTCPEETESHHQHETPWPGKDTWNPIKFKILIEEIKNCKFSAMGEIPKLYFDFFSIKMERIFFYKIARLKELPKSYRIVTSWFFDTYMKKKPIPLILFNMYTYTGPVFDEYYLKCIIQLGEPGTGSFSHNIPLLLVQGCIFPSI